MILECIKRVIDSSLISKNLSTIPLIGASDNDIEEELTLLPRTASKQQKMLIKNWNGLKLDVINFYGFGKVVESIDKISDWQFNKYDIDPVEKFGANFLNSLIIADTPSGQLVIEDTQGKIFIFAFDGLPIEKVASDLEDFICNYVFGKRAAEFAGEEWLQELKDAGLV